jgi:hypothetical protein
MWLAAMVIVVVLSSGNYSEEPNLKRIALACIAIRGAMRGTSVHSADAHSNIRMDRQ